MWTRGPQAQFSTMLRSAIKDGLTKTPSPARTNGNTFHNPVNTKGLMSTRILLYPPLLRHTAHQACRPSHKQIAERAKIAQKGLHRCRLFPLCLSLPKLDQPLRVMCFWRTIKL